MIREIIMPKLGETMEEGYLVSWKKEEGEKIESGDILFEVMSDKTNFEVESSYEGYLRKKLCEPSEEAIPVTTLIGYMSNSLDELIPEKAEKQETKTFGKALKETKDTAERINISPLAKRLAREKNLDLSKITGTGPEGRIEKKDILSYDDTNEKQTIDGGYTVMKWSPIRKIIGNKLIKSKQTVPHYYISSTILMDQIIRLKELTMESHYTFTDFLLYFCSGTILKFPLINAGITGEEIRIYSSVDIGIAVSIEDGLIVPVLKDCAKKTIAEISKEKKTLIEKARSGKLDKSEVENPRFIISNLGMFNVETFLPIINPPGAAIMGVGSIAKEALVIENQIRICETMKISLSLDHRIIDGAYAGGFLKKLKENMENPGLLAEGITGGAK